MNTAKIGRRTSPAQESDAWILLQPSSILGLIYLDLVRDIDSNNTVSVSLLSFVRCWEKINSKTLTSPLCSSGLMTILYLLIFQGAKSSQRPISLLSTLIVIYWGFLKAIDLIFAVKVTAFCFGSERNIEAEFPFAQLNVYRFFGFLLFAPHSNLLNRFDSSVPESIFCVL